MNIDQLLEKTKASDKNKKLFANSLARWYELIDHPVQRALVEDNVRFKVVPAGRRSGKTERAKRYVVKFAMENKGNYFFAAPTRDQVKRIYWDDTKLLSFSSLMSKKPSESELIIYLDNGSKITLVGLDQPQRMEGQAWDGGVIDEIADVKETAWALNISPALDTYNPLRPDYQAWCWLIGVPEGRNHYYDMAEHAKRGLDDQWKLYTWKSSEILPADKIESAKKRMSPREFRQEYEASFETAGGRIYEDYDTVLNTTNEVIQPHEQLLWHHDFNYTPMSSGVAVVRNNNFYILDEIVLTSAISRQSALEFIEKYKYHDNKNVIIYGDPAGRAGEKHGHASDYTEMEAVLLSAGWQVTRKVKLSAPAIKDRQNAVRAMICNALGERRLFVNAEKAPYAHKGLSSVQFKEGSTFIEEVSDYQHITTAIGYCIDYEYPITRVVANLDVKPIPMRHHFNT